jgi:stalled ribosome alternative rescue factor ArfA
VKEFLYVDVDRTRSLLAQLQGGLVESLTSESASTTEGAASASFFGIGGSGGYSREARHQESRSFQEMVFVAFEALADEQDLIANLGPEVRQVEAWDSGAVHRGLAAGQLVRITCDVQLLDGALFRQRLERFDKMVDGILALTGGVTPRNSTPKQRALMSSTAKAALMGGVSSVQLSAMSDFVEAFVGESISFRALACGADHLAHGFGGTLLGRAEYIQEERESLLSRYGTVASNWTCVMQVAAIPEENVEGEDESEVVEEEDAAAGGIDRAGMESMVLSLLGLMENMGVMEGPRWPTISVTPLAIYRTIPGRADAE